MQKQKILLIMIIFVILFTGCFGTRKEYKTTTFAGNEEKAYKEDRRIKLPEDGDYSDLLWWNSRILVFDNENCNILIYNEDGELESDIGEKNGLIKPVAGCLDRHGNLYVLDSKQNSLLQYNSDYTLVKKILLNFNSGFGFHELGSIAVYDDVFYISIKSYQDKYNYIYLISEDGKLQKKIERGSIGFLSKMEDSIWFANSFYTEKEQGENRITSGNSHLLKLSKSGEIQDAFALEDKLSLYKVLKFGNRFYASALGCAGIVELDLEKQEVKVLYELPAEEYLNKEIGQMTIDKNGDFWVIDNFNRQLVKVVKQ